MLNELEQTLVDIVRQNLRLMYALNVSTLVDLMAADFEDYLRGEDVTAAGLRTWEWRTRER